MMFTLKVNELAKRFGSRKVFTDISFELNTGQSISIVGPNGSGKSTLLRLLLYLLHPNKGQVKYSFDGKRLDGDAIRDRSSLVAPYLNLYDQLTAEENLKFFSSVAGHHVTGKEINNLLALVGLEARGMDNVADYSSGMKQRLKYAVALLNKPDFLFLDEPSSNLDDDGKRIVGEIIKQYRDKSIIVIATNEPQEYGFAERVCRLGG